MRAEPNSNSNIIYKLKENEVFFYYESNFRPYEETKDWIYVMIPRNIYSICSNNKVPYYGYIHKTRLKPLNELEKVLNSRIELDFDISKVDTLKKTVEIINRNNPSESYSLIDGVIPLGLEIPLDMSLEVSSLSLICKDQVLPQPRFFVQDLYNVTFTTGEYRSPSKRFTYYLKDDITFIHQKCSDGAGYFEIVWVIKECKIIQRLAGWIY